MTQTQKFIIMVTRSIPPLHPSLWNTPPPRESTRSPPIKFIILLEHEVDIVSDI